MSNDWWRNELYNYECLWFIDYLKTCDNVDDVLENCKTQSEKGFIFERLFDIVIKFGFCDSFKNSDFNHLTGNSNNGKLNFWISWCIFKWKCI